MPRKKPSSTRKKKEEQQLKRAVKRGPSSEALQSSRRLQSSFIRPSPEYLDKTKSLASNTPLIRPIPSGTAIHPEHVTDQEPLTCTRRPKWRFEMTKKEVESNEAGLFRKWIKQTDELLEQWQSRSNQTSIPSSPTYFERNLEVWRQLWRVVEISQILLVLLDSRCPLLHYPPSLANYLADRRVILVLTKTDIPRTSQVEAWVTYLRGHYDIPVVRAESYTSKATQDNSERHRFQPYLPQGLREQLVAAIRDLHSKMIQPPEKVKTNPAWMKGWKPSVPTHIDWEAALQFDSETPADPMPLERSDEAEDGETTPFLTVGLLGQPNTGKSSLLNALFGKTRVRASKTPGKTKHFQTLFWTSQIRLVDCPGVVLPNYVPMEMQVLSGILPIPRISAFPACVHFVSNLLPVEKILKLTHPAASEEQVVDKRTWREGMKPIIKQTPSWTAMDILLAYATQKGWFTAKAGRPDVGRAANALLRALAEGRIPWAFWPPGTPPEFTGSEPGTGISLAQELEDDIIDDEDSDQDITAENIEEDNYSNDDDDAEFPDTTAAVGSTLGRFALLEVEDDGGDDDSENEEGIP
ncbi:hypothetical protein VKT23_005385 [Stygiomarasmius scandens]|uniref:Guanine nucleotide-binding protein-like 1 n=1 Tax=Marasmiellus scandens TaxID=2682957 RepID=A0ABR1JUI2_9AGAR